MKLQRGLLALIWFAVVGLAPAADMESRYLSEEKTGSDTKLIAPISGRMTNARLDALIRIVGVEVEGQRGAWQFQYDGRQMVVFTDESHNRMRIMTPVVEDQKIKKGEFRTLLAANFDRALDARYAIGRGYLWSAFIHPLAELTDEQVLDAVKQVHTLAETYGGAHASSDMKFGGSE